MSETTEPASTVDGIAEAPLESRVPREIWIMVAAAFAIALGYGLIAPLLPQFVVSFGVSFAQAGMVVAIFSASRLCFAPMSGRLIDRIGSRHVYLTGLMIVAVSTSLVAAAQAYWHILALRGIAGIGSTMFTVSAMGLIVRVAPPSIRGRCMALYASAFLLGNVAGPLLGAALSFLGFRWPFVIYGCAIGVSAVIVSVFMPKVPRGSAGQKNLPQPMTLPEAWRDTAFRAAVGTNFAQGWINMGVRVSVLPIFAAAVIHNGASAAGFALAAFAAGNALVLQFSGRLADAVGRRLPIVAGMALSGIFMGLMGFADQVWSLIVVSLFAGAAAGLLSPGLQAAVGDVVGRERSGGKILSAFQMAGDLGQIAGPIIVGWLADAWGFRAAFVACSAVAVVGIVGWFFAREPLANAHPPRLIRLRDAKL